MASPSPPKPWERAMAGSSKVLPNTAVTTNAPTNSNTSNSIMAADRQPATANTAAKAVSSPPPLPSSQPPTSAATPSSSSALSSLSSVNRMNSSPYGGFGGYGSYSSPYSRLGGFGGSMYGGMGGYGGMYGGMGGMGSMYGGMPGMPGDPNDPNSLTNSFGQSTQATFQIIESIVGAFGGFAQMLESTYMATHSSFFAMVSVAEQLGNLRQTLGSVLGIFTLLRWLRTLFAKVTGRPLPASATDLTPSNFAAFQGQGPNGQQGASRPSRKPFIIFVLAVFGLPYLMGKFIRAVAANQEENERRRLSAMPAQQPIDPSKLDFCRVTYDWKPENVAEGIDLEVKKGDLVAVLTKSDPMGNPSDWWRCRARDGRVGYLPSTYLETIQRKQPVMDAPATPAIEAAPKTLTEGPQKASVEDADPKKIPA